MSQQTTGGRLALVRALCADIAAEVDEAFEAHGGGSPEAAFDAEMDRQIEQVLPGSARFALADEQAALRWDAVFQRAERAAEMLGSRVPEPELFHAAGVDFAELHDLLAQHPQLEPVVAPFGLGADAWQRAFEHSNTGTHLLLAPEALREFAALDLAPETPTVTTTAGVGAGYSTSPSHSPSSSVRWSMRLIPASPSPSLLGLSFAHGPHVTLPEMLMLQLTRVLGGEDPVDRATFTWLAGSIAGGRLAARHVFDSAEQAVRVNCREPHSQGPHMGARPPVSGA